MIALIVAFSKNVVIIGRRSFEEIGKPLSNRTTIVISNTTSFYEENCFTAKSLQEAIKLVGDRDVYISGGAKLYEQALPIVEKMYITEIETEIEGDTYFPQFQEELFVKEVIERMNGEIPYNYITYTKKLAF